LKKTNEASATVIQCMFLDSQAFRAVPMYVYPLFKSIESLKEWDATLRSLLSLASATLACDDASTVWWPSRRSQFIQIRRANGLPY
jgi:hypothetical protein